MGTIHNEHFYEINIEIILSVLVVLLWVIRGPFRESDGSNKIIYSDFLIYCSFSSFSSQDWP